MRKLFFAIMLAFLTCTLVAAAEPDEAADGDAAAKPPASPPKQEQKAPPKKTEYDKVPYSTLHQKADAGDLTAQFELGSRYNYGRDLPKNTREALRWLRKAGEAGNIDAQRLLAIKLFEGHDVPVNQEEAFKWALMLANSGDRPGQFTLGNLYANGEGTERNLIRAYMWFDIAATPVTGKTLADLDQKAMDAATDARDKTSSLLQPEEELEAQQLASDWWLNKGSPKTATPAKKKKAAKPAAKNKAARSGT